MRPLIGFIKTTLIGGLLIVFPAAVVFILLQKAVSIVHPFLSPVTSRLPAGLPFPGLVAFAIESTAVFFGCFIIGVLVKTRTGQRCRLGLEKAFFEKVPGYALLRSFTRKALGEEEDIKFKVALVEMEGGLVPSFIIEEHAEGGYTVFVPTTPMPTSGSIYIFPREKVHLVDVSFAKAFQSMTKLGAGSGELVRAMRRD